VEVASEISCCVAVRGLGCRGAPDRSGACCLSERMVASGWPSSLPPSPWLSPAGRSRASHARDDAVRPHRAPAVFPRHPCRLAPRVLGLSCVATRPTTRALAELCVAFHGEVAAVAPGPAQARRLVTLGHPSTSSRLLLEVSPPSVLRSVRPLPASHRSARPSAPSCHRGSLVPPSWFLTTSTVSSGLTARALLQPAADPGVHRVSVIHSPAPDRSLSRAARPAGSNTSPRCTHPAKMLPACSASLAHRATRGCRVTRGRSLRAVARGGAPAALSARRHRGSPLRFLHIALDFEVSLRRQVCRHRSPLPATDSSVLPWASVLPLTTEDCVAWMALRRTVRCSRQLVMERFTSKSGTEVPSPR